MSNVVMYFIILATAATLFKAGKTTTSATDGAEALRPLAGDASASLLALGLKGAGFLAVPILSGSAAYGVAEAFGWKYGLDRRPDRAREFYAEIAVATVVGMLINFVGINPINVLGWIATGLMFVAAIALVFTWGKG